MLLLKTDEVDADDPAGLVIESGPGRGLRSSPRAAPSRIVVSKGPAPVPIPSVADMSERADALAALERGSVVTTERRDDEIVAREIAIETVPPAGTEQAPDTGVTLVISDGPAPVGVPNVVGAGYDDAAKQLQGRGFTVVRAPDEFSDTRADKDKVIRTDPAAGQLIAARLLGHRRRQQGPRDGEGAELP